LGSGSDGGDYEVVVNGIDACLAAGIFHYETYTVSEVREYPEKRKWLESHRFCFR